MENMDLDLVTFVDEDGNEIVMEVIDYFFYEGEEYATLVDYDPDSACGACDKSDCEACENLDDTDEVVIMKVVPVGEDEEEFIPVDEETANRIIALINSGELEDLDDEDE